MTTILTVAIWGAAAAGYVSMLVLTERSAARYVAGVARCRPRAQVYVLNAATAIEAPVAVRFPVDVRRGCSPEAA